MYMKRTFIFLLGMAITAASLPAFGVSKEIIQLQTQVQAIQDQMARMQQSFDEGMGVMKSLINQSTDNINKMTVAVDALQKSLQQQNADTVGKVDQVSGQVQALNDSLDELKARIAKVSKQIDDMNAARQNLNPAPSTSGTGQTQPPQTPPQAQAPPPDVLYNNALHDYNAAKYQLAFQEFSDYLKFYPQTELAGNAQFYVADIEYRQGNYEQAAKDYDKVLEQYPGGNKTASAELRKGFALLELGQRQAGVRELNNLIQRFPRSVEAAEARDRLRREGALPTASRKPSPARPR